MADRLADLGGIPVERVRRVPSPGQAVLADLVANNEQGGALCELVDGTLVEKAMGYEESIVAIAIASMLRRFAASRRLGVVSGADGMFRLIATSIRGPDVAFVSRDRFPGGVVPQDAYPSIAPNLAVEVLSRGNTREEMTRKRIEYFHSGTQVVWLVDCRNRTVAVYTSPHAFKLLSAGQVIDGGEALPGFTAPVAEFFADLD